MIGNKRLFRENCSFESYIPIFSNNCWLYAICGKDNCGVRHVQENGKVVASKKENLYMECPKG